MNIKAAAFATITTIVIIGIIIGFFAGIIWIHNHVENGISTLLFGLAGIIILIGIRGLWLEIYNAKK